MVIVLLTVLVKCFFARMSEVLSVRPVLASKFKQNEKDDVWLIERILSFVQVLLQRHPNSRHAKYDGAMEVTVSVVLFCGQLAAVIHST